MKNRFVIAVCLMALCWSMWCPEYVYAGAIDNSGVGTRGLGMGSAFSAIAEDASAVYYNPAGLSQGENNKAQVQAYGFFSLTGFDYSTGTQKDTSDDLAFNPGFFISKKYDKWAFGYGLYIPYAGGGATYNDFQGTGHDIDGYEAYIAQTPSVAFQISPALSVGAGVSVYYGILESNVFQYTEIESKYDGIAGYGYNIGLLYKLNSEFSVGFQLKSRVPVEMDGTVKVENDMYGIPEGDSTLKFTIPYYYILGFSYKPVPDLTLGFEGCYMQWGDMDTRTLITDGVRYEAATGYKDSWRFSLGVEYKLTDRIDLMAGFKFVQSSTRDAGLDVSNDTTILVPPTCDVDYLSSGISAGYHMTDNLVITFMGFYVSGYEEQYNSKTYDIAHISMAIGCDYIF